MKPTGKLIARILIAFLIFIVSCTPKINTLSSQTSPTPFQPQQEVSETTTPVTTSPVKITLQLPPYFPSNWQAQIQNLDDIEIIPDTEKGDFSFIASPDKKLENSIYSSSLIFAAAVPFFTINDSISGDILRALWNGKAGEGLDRAILVTQKTSVILTAVWGEPGANVNLADAETLLTAAEGDPQSIAIIPFTEISPRWKILKVDGLSPLDKPFDQQKYPLTIYFHLVATDLNSQHIASIKDRITQVIPATNRDESKMTVLVMTGTTAITRGLAYKVMINDTDYPTAMVRDWFRTADLKHVSNESPFVEDCPYPDPYTSSLVFCSDPVMIEVLEKIGINVVELTGNHINDYQPENLVLTMQMYKDRGWAYYAAGVNPEAARQPVLLENNGNKIAFIGCNAVGPNSVWAKPDRAGAAECDFEYLYATIRELKQKGYVVITTFQHEELTKQDGAPAVLMFAEKISEDFTSVANAGSDIVQGSQAHYPMGFEFVGNSLIHYGLGNFLFDQMWEPNRNEFIDRHIIYDGKYINTEVLTAILMDWSQPTPMDESQREQFLQEIFTASLKRKK